MSETRRTPGICIACGDKTYGGSHRCHVCKLIEVVKQRERRAKAAPQKKHSGLTLEDVENMT